MLRPLSIAAWTSEIEVSIKRVQTTDVIAAGTILDVRNTSRFVRPGLLAALRSAHTAPSSRRVAIRFSS